MNGEKISSLSFFSFSLVVFSTDGRMDRVEIWKEVF